MLYFRWATLLGIVVATGLVGCSGSTQVATNDPESSSSETGGRPNRKVGPIQRDSSSVSRDRQPSNSGSNANSGRNANAGTDMGGNQNVNAAPQNTRSTVDRSGSQTNASRGGNNASKRRQPSMGGGGAGSNAAASAGNDNPRNRAGNAAGPKPKKTLAKATPTGKKGTNPGDELPEINGRDMDGNAFKLSDYRGKVIMVDFWGDW